MTIIYYNNENLKEQYYGQITPGILNFRKWYFGTQKSKHLDLFHQHTPYTL